MPLKLKLVLKIKIMQYRIKNKIISWNALFDIKVTALAKNELKNLLNIRQLVPITAKIIPVYIKKGLTLSSIRSPSLGNELFSVKWLATNVGVNKKLKKIAMNPKTSIKRPKIFTSALINLLLISQLYVLNNLPHAVSINLFISLLPFNGYQK